MPKEKPESEGGEDVDWEPLSHTGPCRRVAFFYHQIVKARELAERHILDVRPEYFGKNFESLDVYLALMAMDKKEDGYYEWLRGHMFLEEIYDAGHPDGNLECVQSGNSWADDPGWVSEQMNVFGALGVRKPEPEPGPDEKAYLRALKAQRIRGNNYKKCRKERDREFECDL